MKKLFFFCSLLLSMTAFGQTGTGTSEVFVFQPVSSQRVRTTDSVQVFATLVTNHTVTGVSFAQVSGPTVTIGATTAYYGASVATSSFWLSNLTAGTYVFKATGASSSGTTGSVTDTLTVIPATVCPVCPAAPTVTGVTVSLFGVTITIPAGSGTKVTLSNGTTQAY